MRDDVVNIAYVCDQNYLMQVCVSILSLINNKSESSRYNIYIVASEIEEKKLETLKAFESKQVHINVIEENIDRFKSIDHNENKQIRAANESSLLKFILPQVLRQCKKVLYIDADTIVRTDLSELYETQLGNSYAGVIIDSGSIYYKHKYVRAVEHYFNSGVMLLNLKIMRKDNVTEELIECKKNITDSLLMDQDVFNIVFSKKVVFLPIKYNFMCVNLERAKGKYSIEDINKTYGETYQTLDDIKKEACIIHYASKDKPWNNRYIAMADLWYFYYDLFQKAHPLDILSLFSENEQEIKVSVIIPCFNVEDYVLQSVTSVLNQTLKEIEVICINDGSEDTTLDILKECESKDKRITVISQENKGQAVARNIGIRKAKGKYIYFLDSDDYIIPKTLEILYDEAERKKTDVLYFNGNCFYESAELQKKYSHYMTCYSRQAEYPVVVSGQELYVMMIYNSDYVVSPCLQFFSRTYLLENKIRFHENTIYEDNYFTLASMLMAKRVSHLPKKLFYRRVRKNSTMTSNRTKEYCCGIYECIKDTLQFMQQNDFDRHIIMIISRQLSAFITKYEFYYEQLSEEEKEYVDAYVQNDNIKMEHLNTPFLCLKSISFYVSYLEREKRELTRKIQQLQNQMKERK